MSKKLIFTFILFLLLINICYSQFDNWKIISVSRPLGTLNFASTSKGWIYGGDIAYKTLDGGLNWNYPLPQSPPIGLIAEIPDAWTVRA
jgi:hypothetical protein